MIWTKMRWAVLLIFIFLGFSVLFILPRFRDGPGNADSARPSKIPYNIRVALNWVPEPEFGGFYEALREGLYKTRGLEVTLIPGGAGAPTISLVAAHQVEIAVASMAEVLVARERGAKVFAAFAVFQKSPLVLMAHEERKATSIRDLLQSGSLAIERGQAFSQFLEKKWGYSKVKVVPYTGGIAAFLHDKMMSQQGFIFSEPLVAAREGAHVKSFLIADEGYNPYIEVLAFSADPSQALPEPIRTDFILASREGWERYLKNPQATNTWMADLNRGMSLDIFMAGATAQTPLIETTLTQNHGLGFMESTRVKELQDQLLELKVLSVPDPHLDTSFMNP